MSTVAQERTTMQLGPYEINGVYQGDCALLMRKLPDECIDLVVTSPPYDSLRTYNGYVFDFEAIAAELWRVIKPGGVVVWVVADQTVDGSETGTSFRQALHFKELGFNLHDTMIYKSNKPPMNDNRYQACFEYMFVFSKGKPQTFNPIMVPSKYAGHKPSNTMNRLKGGKVAPRHGSKPYAKKKPRENVWFYSTGYSQTTQDDYAFKHPAIFPEALARDHILSWSNAGDIVLDPMCGSGTTLKAAHETGRNYLGFDISAEYVALSRKRVQYAKTPLPLAWKPA